MIPNPHPETDVQALYLALIDAWNRRDAAGYAALCDDPLLVIGFDGSSYTRRGEMERSLAAIFADHATAAYLPIVRSVRLLTPQTALLHAVCGMIPAGQSDLNPAVNAVQSLTAVLRAEGWRVAGFQNTPAQFHGRPEAAQALTDELRQALAARRAAG
jgi:uncharacterized protein (TIGR02246 family)